VWHADAGRRSLVYSSLSVRLRLQAYTHSVDGAYYDRCRCWTLKYGTGIYAVLSRRRTKDLQAHTAFGLLRAFAETENFWAVKLIFYTGTAGIPGVVGWSGGL
jgi:hypothetical protein